MANVNSPTPRTTFTRRCSGSRSPSAVPRMPPTRTVTALSNVPERARSKVRSIASPMRPSEQLRFWAHELAAMASAGLQFVANDYDRDRFERTLRIAEGIATMTIDAEFTPERPYLPDVGIAPSESALRELREETGFRASLERLVGVYDNRHFGSQSPYHFYTLCFRGRITGGDATTSAESVEVVLADPSETPENMSLLQRTMLADSLVADAPAVYQ